MKLFPAIDLYDGKAVRLLKGDYNEMTVYSENPIEIARDFEKCGTKYIHIVDLAYGHVLALNKLTTNCGLVVYNLGTGRGNSVLEVVSAFDKAVGRPIPYVIAPRRPGDIAACYADPTKASKELGFVAKYNIDDMARDAWNWQKKNPNGYEE